MIANLENPTEADFPLIDRCVVCNEICEWQPRYEEATRSQEHLAVLSEGRPLDYTRSTRTIKICAGCIPDDNDELRRLIRREYPVYALRKGI